MKALLGSQDEWEVVEEGFEEPTTTMGYMAAQTKALKEARSKDKETLYMLFRAIDESGFEKIVGAATSKEKSQKTLQRSQSMSSPVLSRQKNNVEGMAVEVMDIVAVVKVTVMKGTTRRRDSQANKIGVEEGAVEEEMTNKTIPTSSATSVTNFRADKKVEETTNLALGNELNEICLLMAQNEVNINNDTLWYLDSDASNHMSGHKYLFKEMQMIEDGHVFFGDASKVEVKGREKTKAFEVFKKFKVMVEKATSRHIKAVRFDRGGVYTSTAFIEYCEGQGIRRFLTAPYSPQQNGVAERKNRTIIDMVQSMLKSKKIPKKLWEEAVQCTIYVQNQCPHVKLDDQTPQEAWSRQKPTDSHLKVFGSVAYAHILNQLRTKLEDKTKKYIFIGYDEKTKGYKLFDPISKKVMASRDVRVNEANAENISFEEVLRDKKRDRTIQSATCCEGYKQKTGIDYDEVFTPVARMKTIRLLISQAAQFKWPIFQIDVKSTFLNGVLEEDVYIEQPPGKHSLSHMYKAGSFAKCQHCKSVHGGASLFTLEGFEENPTVHPRNGVKQPTAIGWKQPIVTLSTCEAEYMVASWCVCHAIWHRNLLSKIELKQLGATVIHVDNKSTIELEKNPVNHERSKHIDAHFHFI
ncbi:hypothetical protein F3Y22_tig00110890pilonHSYRG00631 [Hibiscus syriacus]|uniref:Integrase catalytic domain-containing protein n=1 Tax=Hibiscus syriacus TaxID=106335 RepID=A0A6A2ZI78_HIBSY|nr:hypothetical protein F3Y22_tig00110890pilonHSYRG00631 [Hibiscus syriacus]